MSLTAKAPKLHDTSRREVAEHRAEVITPALYRTVIGHTRHLPWHHAFRYRHPMWLVDLAHLPRGVLLGRVLRFEARDHLGDPARTIRENVVDWVAEHDIDVAGDRIVMLTNARTTGYVFNPIIVFWCLRSDTTTTTRPVVHCVVTEVHNTYGGRHCYLLVPDATGRAQVDKALYVSPFNPVDGSYDMRFTTPTDQVHVAITLRREGKVAFSATLTGTRATPTHLTVLRTLLRYPLAALRVTVLIRYQGIRLFRRGLPVVKRPSQTPKESA